MVVSHTQRHTQGHYLLIGSDFRPAFNLLERNYLGEHAIQILQGSIDGDPSSDGAEAGAAQWRVLG
jgi:hypothetical protein